MPGAAAHRSSIAGLALAAVVACLAGACGLDTSGEDPLAGESAPDGFAPPAEDGAACTSGCSGDDASLSLPPPARDASTDARRDALAPRDAGGAADASDGAAASCSDTCIMQTCGIPCDQGSVCQLYLSCLVLCGFSDAADCSTQCGSTYPTGPLLAACAIACGATCASGGGGDGGQDSAGSTD